MFHGLPIHSSQPDISQGSPFSTFKDGYNVFQSPGASRNCVTFQISWRVTWELHQQISSGLCSASHWVPQTCVSYSFTADQKGIIRFLSQASYLTRTIAKFLPPSLASNLKIPLFLFNIPKLIRHTINICLAHELMHSLRQNSYFPHLF